MKFLPILALLLLTGCVSTAKFGAGQAGDAFDTALGGAEFMMCQGATLGSINRRFQNVAEFDAWKSFCRVRDEQEGQLFK